MKIEVTAAARVIPLTALILAACVLKSAHEQQGHELQVTRIRSRGTTRRTAENCCIENVLKAPAPDAVAGERRQG